MDGKMDRSSSLAGNINELSNALEKRRNRINSENQKYKLNTRIFV